MSPANQAIQLHPQLQVQHLVSVRLAPFFLGASTFIPRIFLTDEGSPAPAGLRSERFASIIRMDKRAFLTHWSAVASFISIAPPCRRPARALGVHGERLVYDIG